MKGQITSWFRNKYELEARKNLFIRQLKINYQAMYAPALKNNTNKTTEQDKKASENKQKRYKNNCSNSEQV